jgi:hypothetical protein
VEFLLCYLNMKNKLAEIKLKRAKAGITGKLPAGTKDKILQRDKNRADTILKEKQIKNPVKVLVNLPAWAFFNERRRAYPKKRIWTDSAKSGFENGVAEFDNGRIGWNRVITDRYITVQSYATVHAGGRCALFYYDGERNLIKSPKKGWKFATDGLGLKIVKIKNESIEFHLNSYVFLNKKALKECVGLAEENYKQRKQKEKDEAKFSKWAKKHQSVVCVADSIEAGNCLAGTEQFISNYKLGKYVKSSVLQEIADKSQDPYTKKRIKITIFQSFMREKKFANVGAELFYPIN